MNPALRSLVALLGLASTASIFARDYRLTLAAAEVERVGQVVAFKLPADAPKNPAVRDAAGKLHPVQVDADGTVRFVVPAQAAGATLAFTLTSTPAAARDAVTAAPKDGDLALSLDGQPVLAFRVDRARLPRADIKPEFVRAGHVSAIYSPAGQLVTDDYAANHVHQHAIMTPWTKTSFQGRAPDFWNMGAKTGAEDLVALDRSWSGPVHGGLIARLKMVDLSAPTPVVALNEMWQLTVYNLAGAARPARMFDLVVTQACATADPLILPQYHYGGFGFRGAWAWNGPGDKARFLTSEGVTDRLKGNNTRTRWCYLGGVVEGGALAGTVTLGHPGNFRAPQPVRLHPDMPYFSYVPQQLGEFRIEPGKPYVWRFRFVTLDGEPDGALLDAYWHGYAQPAVVKVDAL